MYFIVFPVFAPNVSFHRSLRLVQIANQYQVYFDKENLFVTICCVSSDNFVNSVKLFIPKTKMVRFIFGKIKACRLKNHLNALNCNAISQ